MKFSKIKGTLLMLCALSIVMSTFSACGDKASSETSSHSDALKSEETVSKSEVSAEENPYSEHMVIEALAIEDIKTDWPIVKEAMEKFNFEIKQTNVLYDVWAEKTRTMVATDSLPEYVAWFSFDYGEYADWSKQGVFKAIPNLEKYPNISRDMKSISTLIEKMKKDGNGEFYCIPKTINSNPYNNYGHTNIFYRRDWAKAMGYDFDTVQEISLEEYRKYLKDIIEKDPGKVGKNTLVSLDAECGYKDVLSLLMLWNPEMDTYVKRDGKYVFGSTLPETTAGLKELQQWYKEGLIAKDFYTYKSGEGRSRFIAGRSAVLASYFGPEEMQKMVDNIKKLEPEFKYEDLGILLVKGTNDKVNCAEKSAYWAASAFNKKIEDKKMERILAIHDWAISDETIEKLAYGIKDEDWTRTADGKVKLNWPTNADGTFNISAENGKAYLKDQWLFQKWFHLEGDDTWLPENPSYSPALLDTFKRAQEKKDEIGNIVLNDYDVMFFNGTNKNKYNTFHNDVIDEITKLIVSSTDIEKDWSSWVATMEPKINSVLSELDSMN